MEAIQISVSGSNVAVTKEQPIVKGTVGLPVEFYFDETWSDLQKTAVFRVNGRTVDQVSIENSAVVPWELLEKPGCLLWCGVYGCNGDGTLQIPTLWAELGTVEQGADPSGDESADPALPVWQQVTEDIGAALDEILQLQESIIQGILPSGDITGGDDL